MYKKFILVLVAFISLFFSKEVYAYQDSFYHAEWLPNIFVRSESPTFLYNQQMRFIRSRSTNQAVYCIEHGEDVINDLYYNGSFENFISDLNITKEQLDKIKALSYYGYGYDDHIEDKWYAITQVLIWKVIYKDMDIYYTDSFKGNKIIQFEEEEKELMNMVNNHYSLPDFNNQEKTIKVNDTLILKDYNLKDYKVVDNEYVDAKIENNTLKIKALKEGNTTLKLEKKTTRYNTPVIVYRNANAQDFITIGNYDTININLNINTYDTTINIKKIGEKVSISNNTYKYENVALDDVYFELYANQDIYENNELKYSSNDLINTYITDKNGNIKIDNLYYGKYKLVEIKSSNNNEIINKETLFELTPDNKNIFLEIKNNLKKYKLEITKIDNKSGNVIPNTYINLYLEDGTLIYSGKTDENGKIIIDDLFIGKFYIKEIKSNDKYKLNNNPINFTIDNNTNGVTQITMTNEIIENVPKTYKNDLNYSLIFSLPMFGICLYEIKKRKNN